MPVIVCPYCNATTNKPLKFCVSCGRLISSTDSTKLGGLKQQTVGGLTRRLNVSIPKGSFKKIKGSYQIHRLIREFIFNFIFVLMILLLYYAAAKMILKEVAKKDLDQSLPHMLTQPIPNRLPHTTSPTN